jgi:hypothetical protein
MPESRARRLSVGETVELVELVPGRPALRVGSRGVVEAVGLPWHTVSVRFALRGGQHVLRLWQVRERRGACALLSGANKWRHDRMCRAGSCGLGRHRFLGRRAAGGIAPPTAVGSACAQVGGGFLTGVPRGDGRKDGCHARY